MKGKKGFIGSILMDFWAYAVFVFVIIIFAILFQFMKGGITQTISSETNVINAKITLLNFIRTPVEIDINRDNINESLTVGELIVFTSLKDEDSEAYLLLKDKADRAMKVLQNKREICGVYLGIEGNVEKKFRYDSPFCDEKNIISEHMFLIPTPKGVEGDFKAKIRMYGESSRWYGP